MHTVLFVDDEKMIRELFVAVLEINGFHVTTAANASEAIEKLGTGSFDVVVTDLRMEEPLSGFEVVNKVNTLSRRPPVVLLTAFPIPQSTWREAGADALLIKGTEIRTIVSTLNALLAKAEAARAHKTA